MSRPTIALSEEQARNLTPQLLRRLLDILKGLNAKDEVVKKNDINSVRRALELSEEFK